MNTIKVAAATMALLVGLAGGGCGGTEAAEPRPLTERVVRATDLPGFQLDGPAIRADLTQFVAAAEEVLVQATAADARHTLAKAGFSAAVIQPFKDGDEAEVVSVVAQFATPDGAQDVFEWGHEDSLKPCPGTCDIDISRFDVDGISDATGVTRRRATDSDGAGPKEPFESHEVSFSDGRFLYVVFSRGEPGQIEHGQVVSAAEELHRRVEGSPPAP